MAKNRSKKSPRHFFRSRYFIYIFILISIIAGIIFLTRDDPAEAAASFYLSDVTPDEEVRRGGPLVFDVMVQGQTAGSAVNTGIEFDKRKLRLDSIDSGVLGTVTWETIADNGNNSRVVIHNTNISAGDNQQFARVNFTIIDETDERDAQGRGFVELCTIFDPEIETPTSDPNQPTSGSQPTNIPTTVQNTPIPTRPSEPITTPIPTSQLDLSKLCIPLEINGSPADKIDILMIPSEYPDYNRFIEQAQLALDSLKATNVSQYSSQTLQKMNWYLFNTNHASAPNMTVGNFENPATFPYLEQVSLLCSFDRFVIFIDDFSSSPGFGGKAILYEGLVFGAESLYHESIRSIFPHEWGHAVGGLADEYDTGINRSTFESRSQLSNGTYYYNCSIETNGLNSGPDPCPKGSCFDDPNDPKYKTACAKWDCNKIECDDLQKQLFADAGCYQRCSFREAYRPAPLSIMDELVSTDPNAMKFNGPSLYSLIQFTFNRYR